MLQGNQIELEMLKKGLVNKKRKQKRRKRKKFTCHKCGAPMIYIDDTNVMACTGDKCVQYFIFDRI